MNPAIELLWEILLALVVMLLVVAALGKRGGE